MIEATRGRDKGQWWPLREDDGSLSATYYCYNCGNPMGLMGHTIQADGTINPSVVCPHQRMAHDPTTGELTDMRCPTVDCNNCDFHNEVKLIGWMP